MDKCHNAAWKPVVRAKPIQINDKPLVVHTCPPCSLVQTDNQGVPVTESNTYRSTAVSARCRSVAGKREKEVIVQNLLMPLPAVLQEQMIESNLLSKERWL